MPDVNGIREAVEDCVLATLHILEQGSNGIVATQYSKKTMAQQLRAVIVATVKRLEDPTKDGEL